MVHALHAVGTLVLLSCLASMQTRAHGPSRRNHADDHVRGGAWIHHEDAGPCGRDPLRRNCSFAAPHARLLAATDLKLSLPSLVIDHLDVVTVTVQPGAYKPTSYDWVGVFCVDDEANPPPNKEYLDWHWMTGATDSSLRFGPLINMRCAWQFRYFTYEGANAFVKVAESPLVRMRHGPEQPLHVRVAATCDPTAMRVMWVSAPVDAPFVEYWEASSNIVRRVNVVERTTYAASDMCEARATTVASNLFRDPGIIYSAVLPDLKPEATYSYRIHSGSGKPHSKTFKLRTPPAPGVQNGVTSFFVFGDLGDKTITPPASSKRAATTVELIRRDMSDPRSNYVAVMHDGDLSYAMGAGYLWDQFGALIEPVASEVAYMVAVGNHEYCYMSGGHKDPSGAGATNGFHPPEGNYGRDSGGECGVPTNKRFIMPDNGNQVFWWSVEMGLVHHTTISSEHDYQPGSTMYTWLERDLASVDRSKTPWLFLHLHRPMYTSENYPDDHRVSLLIRKNLEPLLAKYRVDAVFSGHYHAR
ncbi:hypothetical protein P43SY_009362 [Pythium insidiosum]|uniref:Purple acid phosphatase n=1 Tax=Pythium insidiosum TaxID=114742 RepID=A0AAD5LRH2_PYTIN|nr:hypothetical protein P43SY_009362 [Pythium insidiosum]